MWLMPAAMPRVLLEDAVSPILQPCRVGEIRFVPQQLPGVCFQHNLQVRYASLVASPVNINLRPTLYTAGAWHPHPCWGAAQEGGCHHDGRVRSARLHQPIDVQRQYVQKPADGGASGAHPQTACLHAHRQPTCLQTACIHAHWCSASVRKNMLVGQPHVLVPAGASSKLCMDHKGSNPTAGF